MNLYLILTTAAWTALAVEHEYRAPSLDIEGFIHASASPEQVCWVANRRYREEPVLVVLEVDRCRVGSPIADELTATGEGPFPHIYGPMDLDAVRTVRMLKKRDGRWEVWAEE